MNNPVARGLVMVPAVLLGGVFTATGLFWSQEGSAGSRGLAIGLGLLLLAAGLLVGLRNSPPDA
ncbi:MAG: hypothetical protein F4Z75_04950 [Synechococcus sp. SB0668_bin_15]|nr:hypothetical protein [Synechococcus sp. SB0668_bin_15]MXZ83911.1 hypothetical protein [Synechococcus sp. SB0666_bin_14]MYA91452.1 hypothetical protein [Synechococcus sp. SB0663_bin_10]MYC48955.1 hypothetical protein [Synechococcus sp. SB0662_bin_14]MYG46839.1 hypothetical protein [Synechococcus sp. SB0675_bin_6]MYJ58992.1 hypothetical protein [Synechococcus sp. SB0672_bin_6]